MDSQIEGDSLFKELKINHLYIRFFDVDYHYFHQKALPVASIDDWRFLADSSLTSVTPSIFITNKVLTHSSENDLDSLASNIFLKTQKILKNANQQYSEWAAYHYFNKNNISVSTQKIDSLSSLVQKSGIEKVQDILIDCDWTESTKDKYFYLLYALKKYFKGYELAATIRLWQYKMPEKAGVPPVDRGLLMCYNIENHTKYEVENSIASVSALEKYLIGSKPYNLDLDIALPMFECIVWFREQKYQGLFSFQKDELNLSDTSVFEGLGENKFAFKIDTILNNQYIRSGDVLRTERVSPAELQAMSLMLQKKISLDADARISFFSWDEDFINRYGIENIEKIYQIWAY